MLLETERLRLRDWTLEDAEHAFAVYGDPEVARYLGTTGQPVPSLEKMRESLTRIMDRSNGKPMGFWALELKEGGELVGGALLQPLPDESDVEVGYHLGKAHWGKGYATEIASRLVRYGFEEVGLKRIVGVTYPQNKASMRVLEKSGLSHQGQSKYGEVDVELFVVEAGD
jgi:ribosomal-protein-alanine N-acetyltransferase